MFDAIGKHAVSEWVSITTPVTYNPVSRATGDFTSLNFKTRNDYDIPIPEVDVPAKYAVVSSNYTAVTVADGAVSSKLILDTEIVDANSIVSFDSDNDIVFGLDGWFDMDLVIDVNLDDGIGGHTALTDGYFVIRVSNSGSSDNVFEFVGVPSGSIVNFNDFTVHSTVSMVSTGTVNITVDNQTGYSIDVYANQVVITQKP